MHRRKEIRQLVVSRLAARSAVIRPTPGVAVMVEGSRSAPVQDEQLPAVLVAVEDDEHVDTNDTRDELRACTLLITLRARAESGTAVQDFLDDLAEAVEQCIHEDREHNALAHDTQYDGTTIDLEDAGTVIGELQIRYRVTYPREYAPIEPPTFETIEADFDLESETPDQIEAHSRADLETI